MDIRKALGLPATPGPIFKPIYDGETLFKEACNRLLKQEYPRAFQNLLDAAYLEYPPAYAWLQIIYSKGYGIHSRDDKEAKNFADKLEKSKEWLEEEVKKDNPNAFFGLSHLHSIKNELAAAVACSDKAVKIFPHNIFLILQKADLLSNMDECVDEAEKLYRDILKNTPNFVFAHRSLARFLLRKRGKEAYPEVKLHNDAVIASGCRDSSVLYNYGIVLSEEGDNQAAAVKWAEALEIEPNSVHVLNGQAGLLNSLGRCTEAMVNYKKAIALDSNFIWAAAGYAEVLEMYYGELTAEAKAVYENVIEKGEAINPKLEWEYMVLGQAYLAIGKNKNAFECFSKVLEKEGELAKLYAYIGLGKLYIAENDFVEASKYINKALTIDSKNNTDIFIAQAKIFKNAKEFVKAENNLQIVRKKFPDNVEVNLLLGEIFLAVPCYEEAKRFIEKGLLKAPQNKKLLEIKAQLQVHEDMPKFSTHAKINM